ncbi:hypothetical protein QE435_004811 [Rhizobium sp. SORGH_AS 787]|nr:hypothetical protein [Rhizobium sp. SORGH_AS_0787]
MTAARERLISDLRERIASMQGAPSRRAGCLPFGALEIDAVLPGGDPMGHFMSSQAEVLAPSMARPPRSSLPE